VYVNVHVFTVFLKEEIGRRRRGEARMGMEAEVAAYRAASIWSSSTE
jgi:hypothetical protein